MKSAGESGVSDALLISMVLKGLPIEYKPFSVVVMQSDKDYTFSEFKEALRNFEENEKVLSKNTDGRIIMASGGRVVCFHCQGEGHKSNACPKKPKYCTHCKTNTHKTENCRTLNKKKNKDSAKAAASTSNISFNFMVDDNEEKQIVEENSSENDFVELEQFEKEEFLEIVDLEEEKQCDTVEEISQMACQSDETKPEEALVDSGCSAHIFNDESAFTEFDPIFKPEHHSLTLADGTKCSGMAEKRGKVEVTFTSTKGDEHHVTLNNCLYIPSYPQNMFSVGKANEQNASVVFLPNSAHLIAHDGTKFSIRKERSLFWLKMRVNRRKSCDSVNSVRS